MKSSLIKTIACALLTAAALSGCARSNGGTSPAEGAAVVMRGGIKQAKPNSRATGEGQIKGTLSPRQLDVSIITVNYSPGSEGPASDQPKLTDWQGQTADVTRGYFGESSVYSNANDGDTIIPHEQRDDVDGDGNYIYPIDSGRIEYTDESGTGVQKVFYDQEGEYYFVRIFYPYENTIFTSTLGDLGASIIFNRIDGSQDIMCSNLGWGNVYNREVETSAGKTGLVFSHMMSLFRLTIKAENNIVVNGTTNSPMSTGQYGRILGARVTDQPNSFVVDAMYGELIANSSFAYDYDAIDFPDGGFVMAGNLDYPGNPRPGNGEGNPLDVFVPVVERVGYFMVMPGQSKYRIEVETELRKWVYGDLVFDTPGSQPLPGVVYDIEMTLMESYEMKVASVVASPWWMDHIFN